MPQIITLVSRACQVGMKIGLLVTLCSKIALAMLLTRALHCASVSGMEVPMRVIADSPTLAWLDRHMMPEMVHVRCFWAAYSAVSVPGQTVNGVAFSPNPAVDAMDVHNVWFDGPPDWTPDAAADVLGHYLAAALTVQANWRVVGQPSLGSHMRRGILIGAN